MHGIGVEVKVLNLYEQLYLFSEQRRFLGWFINMNMKYYLEDAEQTSFILWEKCKKYNEIFEQRIIFFWANNDSTFDRNQNMLLPWLSNDSHWLFILCIDCTRLDYLSGWDSIEQFLRCSKSSTSHSWHFHFWRIRFVYLRLCHAPPCH